MEQRKTASGQGARRAGSGAGRRSEHRPVSPAPALPLPPALAAHELHQKMVRNCISVARAHVQVEENSHIFLCAAGGVAFREPPLPFTPVVRLGRAGSCRGELPWNSQLPPLGNTHKNKIKTQSCEICKTAAHLQQVEGRTLRQANSH